MVEEGEFINIRSFSVMFATIGEEIVLALRQVGDEVGLVSVFVGQGRKGVQIGVGVSSIIAEIIVVHLI